jgi:hypothetical protein
MDLFGVVHGIQQQNSRVIFGRYHACEKSEQHICQEKKVNQSHETQKGQHEKTAHERRTIPQGLMFSFNKSLQALPTDQLFAHDLLLAHTLLTPPTGLPHSTLGDRRPN